MTLIYLRICFKLGEKWLGSGLGLLRSGREDAGLWDQAREAAGRCWGWGERTLIFPGGRKHILVDILMEQGSRPGSATNTSFGQVLVLLWASVSSSGKGKCWSRPGERS